MCSSSSRTDPLSGGIELRALWPVKCDLVERSGYQVASRAAHRQTDRQRESAEQVAGWRKTLVCWAGAWRSEDWNSRTKSIAVVQMSLF